jgi:predicted nucleic acid-binding protein
MKDEKYKIYLDTSIISAFFDNKKPIRQLMTEKWVENESKNYDIYISTLVLAEINKNPDENLKIKMLDLLNDLSITVLEIDNEIEKLANYYRKEILSKEINDTLHIATASTNNINAILSWNFRHIVNLKTIETIHKINIKNNYPVVEIISIENLGGYKYGNI